MFVTFGGGMIGAKINNKDICRSVFLTICHCILGVQLAKTHSFRLLHSFRLFFGDFAHWESKCNLTYYDTHHLKLLKLIIYYMLSVSGIP